MDITWPHVNKARKIAAVWHAKQLYGSQPYMYHINGVYANTMGLIAKLDNMLLSEQFVFEIIAYLHDILEDTDITYDELVDEFGTYIADSIAILTHNANDTYAEYILKIVESNVKEAIIVKLADLNFNLDESKKTFNDPKLSKNEKYGVKQRIAKYELAKMLLKMVALDKCKILIDSYNEK